MLIFILITIMFLIAGNGIVKIFFEMIRPGGALDVVFKWQKMLNKLYAKQTKVSLLLENALGGCERCFTFWFMPFWFICYFIVTRFAFHVWITDWCNSLLISILINIIWYGVFHILGAMCGFLLLKLTKKDV